MSMPPDDFSANNRRKAALRAEDDGQDALENAKCGVNVMLKAFAVDRSFTMQDDTLHTLEQDLERVQKTHETLCTFLAHTLPLSPESRVYSADFGRLVQSRVMSDAATHLAAPEADFAVAPDVRFKRISSLNEDRAKTPLAEKVPGASPERSVTTADRAVAVQHPTRRGVQTDANSPAVTRGSDHKELQRLRGEQ